MRLSTCITGKKKQYGVDNIYFDDIPVDISYEKLDDNLVMVIDGTTVELPVEELTEFMKSVDLL